MDGKQIPQFHSHCPYIEWLPFVQSCWLRFAVQSVTVWIIEANPPAQAVSGSTGINAADKRAKPNNERNLNSMF